MLQISYKTIYSLFFILGVVLIVQLFDLGQISQYGPVSLHRWRQSDCTSIARCYYESGMHFFQPKVHHMIGGDNAAVSEFPIMYYAAAAFYHLWGPKDVILRWLDFLVLLLGLYAVARLLLDLFQNWLFSYSGSFLLLGSPIVAFYGFNYMPNTVGLGFTLAGIYAYYRWVRTSGSHWQGLTTLLFALGGLIKVTSLIPLLAIFATAVFFLIFSRREVEWRQYFPSLPRLFASFVIVLGLVAAWYLWAKYYNTVHNSWLLTTSFKPIWAMDQTEISYTYREIRHRYHDLYFHPYTLAAFLVVVPVLLGCFRWVPRPVYVFYVFMLLGSTAFLALFYGQILVHHYYIIDIMPVFLLSFMLLPVVVRWKKQEMFDAWWFQLLLLGFMIFNVNYGRQSMHLYYNEEWRDPQSIPPSLFKQEELQTFLREKGITYEKDLVLCAPDFTPNNLLYYFNLRGWSEFPDSDLSIYDVKQSAANGAHYLIIADTSYLSIPELQEVYQDPVGVFDNAIYFFDIQPLTGK
jgi:hypothetical protein